MARRSTILASDSDRERVAERLRQAATEGRILAHELEERLARALRARTYGDLDVLVADLPRAASPAKRRSTLSVARSHPIAAVVVLLTVAIVVLMVAAVVASVLPALVVIALLLRFGPWSRGGGPWGRYGGYSYRYGAAQYSRSRRGRSAYWIR